jgi:two-component system catabolic regulation response regulator CreB
MTDSTPRRVLIVEDEQAIADTLVYALGTDGLATEHCLLGRDALAALRRGGFDLMVLDVGLPDMNGFDLCRELRRESDIPVIFLTARSDEIDRIVGLEIGADDYLTKPFNPRELVARVKAILRRSDPALRGARPMDVGTLRIDPRRRDAYVGDRRLDLRPREFDLLAALARDPGVVWSRDDLLSSVWGTDFPGETRTVDVHVSELRRKLAEDGPPIETVKGVGYRLVPPARERGLERLS